MILQVSVIKAKLNEIISMPVGKQKLQFEVRYSRTGIVTRHRIYILVEPIVSIV